MPHLHLGILQPQRDAGVADLQSPLPYRACPAKVLLCLLPDGILQNRAPISALRPLSLAEHRTGVAVASALLPHRLYPCTQVLRPTQGPLATALQPIAV